MLAATQVYQGDGEGKTVLSRRAIASAIALSAKPSMPPGLDSVDGLVELTAGFNTLRALHLLPIYLSLFCTVAMMNLLLHSDVWFCDGTFF